MRKKRKNRAEKSNTLILLIILVPVLGTLMGYLVSKTVLIPYIIGKEDAVQDNAPLNTTPKKDSQVQEGEQSEPAIAYQRIFDVQGIDVYCIQVGAFSSEENARRMVNEVREKGMAAVIRKEGMYKVYTLYSYNEETARKQLEDIRKYYKDAHIAHINYPSIGISFPDTSSEEAEVLWNQLRQCREAIEKIANNAASGEKVDELMEKHREQLLQFLEKLKSEDLNSSLSRYRGEAIKLYSSLLSVYAGKKPGGFSSNQIAMELTNVYIDFLIKISGMV